jgi:hypothetical protein
MEAGTCMVDEFDIQRCEDGIDRGVLTVRYRPHGWPIRRLARDHDGSLADAQGNPLADGQEPVLLEFDVYPRIDFNELDFGTLLPERDEALVSGP